MPSVSQFEDRRRPWPPTFELASDVRARLAELALPAGTSQVCACTPLFERFRLLVDVMDTTCRVANGRFTRRTRSQNDRAAQLYTPRAQQSMSEDQYTPRAQQLRHRAERNERASPQQQPEPRAQQEQQHEQPAQLDQQERCRSASPTETWAGTVRQQQVQRRCTAIHVLYYTCALLTNP